MQVASDDNISTEGLQRVFIHPSSVNFNATSFANSFLIYADRQFTTKPYLRDTTEVTAYPILFFGGTLVPNYTSGLVTIDGWLHFSSPGRVVALIEGLRQALDELLDKKIENPSLDIYSSAALKVVVRLISTDGLTS